jgi:phage baseplate assembly protein V
MIRRGIVVAVDEKTARVRVQMPDLDNMVSNWLPVVHHKTQRDKAYWLPDIGEYVVVAFDEEGEHSDGYVLGAIYNDKDAPPVADKDIFFVRFEDGTEIEYDRKTHLLRVKAQTVQIQAGTVIIQANVNVVGNVNVIGNVDVIGNIHATGSIIDEGGNTPHHSH